MAQKKNNVKRLAKAEIYAAHGIEYVKEGNNIYLISPIGKISPVLIDGNDKIGKGVWHFSTLPTDQEITVQDGNNTMIVKGTCACTCEGCYACTGHYRDNKVKLSNARKTILARYFLPWLQAAILAQIEADKIKTIRIHASGDFVSPAYIEMWRDIIRNTPAVVYWTYTKVTGAESAFDDLPNGNIVKSIIPGIGKNYGTCSYILAAHEKLTAAGIPVYICRCGIDDNQHCNTCKGCSVNKYVLFIEHSTAYKAEKDPLFSKLAAVIENQAKPE